MHTKKLIRVVVALCIVFGLCCGCGERANDNDEYEALNNMLDLEYSEITLTVTNHFDDGIVLTDEYVMQSSDTGLTVDYSVERLSELSLGSVASEKTTYVGQAVIADGNVNYVQGEEVDLDAVATGNGIRFKKEYFENAELLDVFFKADVSDPSGFMGTEITCTSMKVRATFFAALRNITIEYTAENGSRVRYEYVFKI